MVDGNMGQHGKGCRGCAAQWKVAWLHTATAHRMPTRNPCQQDGRYICWVVLPQGLGHMRQSALEHSTTHIANEALLQQGGEGSIHPGS